MDSFHFSFTLSSSTSSIHNSNPTVMKPVFVSFAFLVLCVALNSAALLERFASIDESNDELALATRNNFGETCTRVAVCDNYLVGTCRKRDQSLKVSALDLTRVMANIDGQLKLRRRTLSDNEAEEVRSEMQRRGSDYQLTCKSYSFSGTVLRASCQKRNGQWATTSVDLNSKISNIDGQLTYDG
ncbi:unnamed protein product [Adineta ricciae]|uniref:Cyanovirin-N domain-containing protein n=1 Tax=Adineta ricciae TaxID=249248 RepID=A0A814IJ08_ADIRI|nr:unnamed protein product [Adineta ricciae]